jgi:hypothetical protein
MKRSLLGLLKRCDLSQKAIIILIVTGITLYIVGFIINPGQGWPISRNGLNAALVLMPALLLYTTSKHILYSAGLRNSFITAMISIVVVVVILLISSVLFASWALRGII